MSQLEVIHLGSNVDYQIAWDMQREIHAEVVAGSRPDTVLLLEHSSVYTAGKRTELHERPLDGTPVVDVDRGGKITWHGPGQIVGYPIVRLPDPIDVVAHVRRIEDMLINVCANFGVESEQVEGRSGVWVTSPLPARKVAAIGIRVSQGVTLHGFALNCNNSLEAFHAIVPCGITDATVTTLSAEVGREITTKEVLPTLQEHLVELLRDPVSISEGNS
ncbi:MAG: lipoyl(octanoyl) transferase LipB [Candidatus Nanopelagicales bacterium]